MNRRLTQVLSFCALMLIPAVAFAAGGSGEGSESGGFQDIYAKHGAIVAVLASFGFGFEL